MLDGDFRDRRCIALGWVLILALGLVLSHPSAAQEGAGPVSQAPDAESDAGDPGAPGEAAREIRRDGINLISLFVSGGVFMFPIVIMSLIVVTICIERTIALRRSRILPVTLIQQLGKIGGGSGNFDPRQAYRVCQSAPSAASTVIRAMLLKVGRPHSEVEHTVGEASDREAERLYSNVRWLNLAAAVTPLMGLFGTVWGMIRAFYDTTQLIPGQNKADQLAEGIYIALVTTLGGLAVAIPAAIASHYFEGRIQKLFHEIDDLLFSLMPQIERFEGRVRFSRQLEDLEPGGAAESRPASASEQRAPAPSAGA